MHLIVFDIDGTLTQTADVDSDCYVRALEEVFDFREVDPDWSTYRHCTDSGIFHEIFEQREGRVPSAAELSSFRECFVALLADAARRSPFHAMPGASELLTWISGSERCRASLATGAWRDSARLKMASAGLAFDRFPSASGDDAHERETIIELSCHRAAEHLGRRSFESVVYVGDGIWDARACRNLDIPFIGIGAGAKAEALSRGGAVRTFQDLSETRLIEWLNEYARK